MIYRQNTGARCRDLGTEFDQSNSKVCDKRKQIRDGVLCRMVKWQDKSKQDTSKGKVTTGSVWSSSLTICICDSRLILCSHQPKWKKTSFADRKRLRKTTLKWNHWLLQVPFPMKVNAEGFRGNTALTGTVVTSSLSPEPSKGYKNNPA